jgi:hypothetical protein
MKYLIYVSQAVHPMSKDELADILQHSRKWNTVNSITGVLIYRYLPQEKRGNFLQLIEGDEDVIDRCWERIAADERHHTKVVLESGETDIRMFPDWSMGFRNIEQDELVSFDGYTDLGSEAFWERAQAGSLPDALDLMKSFYSDI